jgi:hypothetical protein
MVTLVKENYNPKAHGNMSLEGMVYATIDIDKVKAEGHSPVDTAIELLRVNNLGLKNVHYIFGVDVKQVGNQMMAFGDAYHYIIR